MSKNPPPLVIKFDLKHLIMFAKYCKEDLEHNSQTKAKILEARLGGLLKYPVSRTILLENMIDTFELYYGYLKVAVKLEKYEEANIIKKTLEAEVKDYKYLCYKAGYPLNAEIDDLSVYYKKTYLDID